MGVGQGCMSNCASNRDQNLHPGSSMPAEAMAGPCMKEAAVLPCVLAADTCDRACSVHDPYHDFRSFGDDGQVMPYIAPPDFSADVPDVARTRLEMLGVNSYNKSAWIQEDDLHRSYEIERKPLGSGSYGLCHKAVSKESKEVRAVKSVPKTDPQSIAWGRDEAKILKYLHHPNIIRIFETFEDTRAIHIIMEHCAGGCLSDKLKNGSFFSELQSMVLMEQVFQAVQYIHSMKICHRDLKPDNFLFLLMSEMPFGTLLEKNILKMIDFGMACVFVPAELMRRRVGTPHYMAPEVLKKEYTESCDLWSCGVMLYLFLSGTLPFNGKTQEDVFRSVEHGNFICTGNIWRKLSDDAKALVRGCLTYDPKNRLTAIQAAHHTAITGKGTH